MKQFIVVSLALFMNLSFVFCQSELKSGDKLTLGKGSLENGDFKYIFVQEKPSNTSLGGAFAGSTAVVLSTERSGAETLVSLLIEKDSVPSCVRKAHHVFCDNTAKELSSMQAELEEKKAEFAKDEKNYALIIKNMKQQEIDDYEQRISAYKSFIEEQKQAMLKKRWIAVLEPAINGGEVKK